MNESQGHLLVVDDIEENANFYSAAWRAEVTRLRLPKAAKVHSRPLLKTISTWSF